MDDLSEAISGAELVVVTQGNPAYAKVVEGLEPQQKVLDLHGVARVAGAGSTYRGLLW